jgi:hypothetical protein
MNKHCLLVVCLITTFFVFCHENNFDELLSQEPCEAVHVALLQLLNTKYKTKRKHSFDVREKNIATLLNVYPLIYGTLKNIQLTGQDKLILREDDLSYVHFLAILKKTVAQAQACIERGEYKVALALLSPLSPDANVYILNTLIAEIEHTPIKQRPDLLAYAHYMIKELQEEIQYMHVDGPECQQQIDRLNELQEETNAYQKKGLLEDELLNNAIIDDAQLPQTFNVLKSNYEAVVLDINTILSKITMLRQLLKLYDLTGNQEVFAYVLTCEPSMKSFIKNNDIYDQDIADALALFEKELGVK